MDYFEKYFSEPEPEPEQSLDYFEYFGKRYENLPYDVEGKIENTFKQDGENFVEDIGNLNNGTDYEKNERNIYDLYIPDSAMQKLNETNGIILWIHGGAWTGGDKSNVADLCKMYAEQGYITATVGYTILNGQYKEFNIYRILDEITACIKAIKNFLKGLGFNENNLKMGIGGYSAGSHLALLYSYLIKNINIIPIKFVINMVGPIGLHEDFFYKVSSINNTLENIEDIATIEKEKNEGKLIQIFPEVYQLTYMNAFWGNRYSNEEINSMIGQDGKIKKDTEEYKKMHQVVKYAYITEIEDKHKLPTLCVYGGTDDIVGVTPYAYLKQKAQQDRRYLYLIYSRYEGHSLIYPTTEDGKEVIRNVNSMILYLTDNFFSEPTNNGNNYDYFGQKYENLPYDVEGKIENTFKQEGENFNEDIGNLNGGADYEKNERNIYDLYIPEYALTRQNEANGIILWIHGGAWVQGDLKDMDSLCKLFSQQGYITATVGYTILNGQYKEFNIYRILDEITACIKAIKKELVAKGFKEDKLKMAIGGYSAGGHLALLYSYLTKNIDIIPIQFIIDFAGPIGLYEEYFYKLKNGNETLENIEDISLIEQAKNEGKLELVGEYSYLLSLMNAFTGNNYTQEDLMSMLNTNGTINKNSEKYIEIDKKIKHSYITQIEDKHKIPTICVYGGTDEVLGISTYAYLKEKANKDGRHLEFIYSRYEGHGLIKPKTREGKQKMQDAIVLIMNYLKYFFTESEPGSQTSIEYYDYFGNISKNISYSVDGKIANSFKNGGDNFIEKIGNINEGDDYPANERNYYDLYIPQYALNRKDKMNGIMLWIHGGAWRGGYMGQMDFLCKLFSQQGYISATIGYTLLLDYFKVFNIYRIMDEITAAIKAIKQELIQKGFDGDKLIMGIGGYSAGGHLALLYSYLINNIDIIPIKFVVDISGPIGLHEKYFYKLENNNNTFENIDNLDAIEQAKTEGKIVKIVDTQIILSYMNAFSGNKFTQDLSSMVDENGQINEESPKYKEMFEFIKYGYVTEIEDKHKLPTIALYGGIDDVVGVSTYAYLKQKADKDERNIDFFYSRYEGHLAIIPSTEDGKETILEI